MTIPTRVLVVDDSMVTRRQVQLALNDFTVEPAASAEAGLAAARRMRPDVLFLEDVMPGTTLADILAELDADPELRTVPVVLLTEDKNPQTEAIRATYTTVVEVLPKPLTREAITEAVEAAIAAAATLNPGPEPSQEHLTKITEVLTSALHKRLTRIPEWEGMRGDNEPAEYYLRKLLPPAILRQVTMQLSGSAAPAPTAAPLKVIAIWDKDRVGFVEPLLEWLEHRSGVPGVDVTTATDPLATVLQLAPSVVVVNADAVGLESIPAALPKLKAGCPGIEVVITCDPVQSDRTKAWQAVGVSAVLPKPIALIDLEQWLFPSAAQAG